MIENALAREEIEYKCDNCGTGAGFISRAFATLPQSLIVVVKRYRFGEAGGSKVEERIGVSRELFLKNLFVDSEVKKREGVARRSLSESVEPLVGNPQENGRSDDSGVSSEVESVATTCEEASQKSDSVASSNGLASSVNDEKIEIVFDSTLSSKKVEECERARSVADSRMQNDKDISVVFPPASTSKEQPHVQTPGRSSSADYHEKSEQPCGFSRLALSPLKMNRSTSGKDEKISESFGAPRKVKILENVGVDSTADSSTSDCLVIDDQEKENSLLSPLKLGAEAGAAVIKQSGGYLKETTPDTESARSGDGSTASREVADIPNDTASASTQSEDNILEKDVNSLKLTDTVDVPNKRARIESTSEAVESLSSHSAIEPSTSYARQITEPLRPSSRIPSKLPQLPATPEQISVIGEVEEKVALVFRPVDEDRQKRWCERFGLKYVGSSERRKRIFGREIEFSIRDIPQSCEVRGDGNCLFRTLCWWITGGSERDHLLLREKMLQLVSFMRKYRSNFSSLLLSQQDMDTHLERMSQDGEWGTQVELAAAACWLKVNIYTFLEGKWLRYRPLFRWNSDGSTPIPLSRSDCNDDRGAIFICNASGCHFQPATSVEPHMTRRNLRPRKDREFVKDISPVHGTPEPPYVFNAADGPVYSLSAVICHHGDSLLTGHYSTFALDVTRREWLDCNDHIITKVSEVEVIDNSSSSGYIFIYNRVEDPLSRL
ncbi:OTU-like cysteine protease [Oesophagostomum dentatum]|uniref:OTU-like cysteine protease n=1 Tax=Oesophagostomum dentatum TaxID=61180 RepID=A0A0B1TCK2_OESDE|nr:OTU-like cysteine protease [Oesophagostomum dentatum]